MFDTPKPVRLMDRILTIASDEESVVLDFFSGSASMGHAVIRKNASDGGRRKFILVQIPEETSSQNYTTLCDVGKERIRRAGSKIKEHGLPVEINLTSKNLVERKQNEDGTFSDTYEGHAQIQLFNDRLSDLDIGFRVLKLDSSNMEDVRLSADEYGQEMLEHMVSNIKPDRTDLDLLFGCLLDWGMPLSLPYKSEDLDGCKVHTYNDGDLIACFDENVPDSVIKTIAKRKPLRAVFRDSSFSSSPAKINVEEIFKMLAPDTRVKVI